MFLPRAMSVTTDAQNAFSRLTKIFHAETFDDIPFVVDSNQELALEAKSASFQWEVIAAPATDGKDKDEKKTEKVSVEEDRIDVEPFQVRDISMQIPRRCLVAIVGRVGSGKVWAQSTRTMEPNVLICL